MRASIYLDTVESEIESEFYDGFLAKWQQPKAFLEVTLLDKANFFDSQSKFKDIYIFTAKGLLT